MAFHVDLPTVPGLTFDRRPTFVCRRGGGGINTFCPRVTWSSLIAPVALSRTAPDDDDDKDSMSRH